MYANDEYGSIFYGNNSNSNEDDVCKDYEIDLMKYLPLYWHSIKEMIQIQKTLGIEISNLKCKLDEVFKQCFIQTATWGLELWEKELGLDVNLNRNYEYRREIIKAKLRGTSTTTIQMIENVAKSFSNGEIKVIEHNDKYYFEIKFIGQKGIPPNMQGLKNAIEEIKPAHLGVEYSYTYTVWKDMLTYKYSEVNTKTWQEVKVI